MLVDILCTLETSPRNEETMSEKDNSPSLPERPAVFEETEVEEAKTSKHLLSIPPLGEVALLGDLMGRVTLEITNDFFGLNIPLLDLKPRKKFDPSDSSTPIVDVLRAKEDESLIVTSASATTPVDVASPK